MENKKTLVLGASTNPSRYSFKAVNKLRSKNHDVIAIGQKPGIISDVEIITQPEPIENLHTVTLYLNPQRQIQYYSYLISLKPKRVIFNPGTENEELEALLIAENIEIVRDCTLVLLSINQY